MSNPLRDAYAEGLTTALGLINPCDIKWSWQHSAASKVQLPAWHDMPTCEGLWFARMMDGSWKITAVSDLDVSIMSGHKVEPNSLSWFGPITGDGKEGAK